ncbi:MAG: ECF-type sigma factor [Rubripirellula sp.]|nr:ECF-type sigma factor [Rubripirellula sp.]
MNEITRILNDLQEGDLQSSDELMPLVYNELRQLAANKLANEKPGQTLQATALVHEAFVRLVDVDYTQQWKNRRHFFGAAAEAMRRILVDRARKRRTEKHGGEHQRLEIDLGLLAMENGEDESVERLSEAIARFDAVDPLACELVKLRYFAGLSMRECSELLEVAPRSADRLWAFAKAWLLREVRGESC